MPLQAIRSWFGGKRRPRAVVFHPDGGVRELLVALLDAMGYQAVEVEDKDAARAGLLRNDGADLFILPLRFGWENGPAFVRELRKDETRLARLPALFLAESGGAADEEKLLARLPRSAILPQPWAAKPFHDAVARLLAPPRRSSGSERREAVKP